MLGLNETHDPLMQSWVESANSDHTDFPIQNLPYGVFRRKGAQEAFRVGVAIGDQVLDLSASAVTTVLGAKLSELVSGAAGQNLNQLMASGQQTWSALRLSLSQALRKGSAAQNALRSCLIPQSEVEYALPAAIGDYTDFYIGIHHATAVGKLFRPDAPLLPNYKWVPIGYHGRGSSLVVSGGDVRRPLGQTRGTDKPNFGASQKIDYELELGFFVGPANRLGHPVSMADAESHLFGLTLFNDWSARDVQSWEYQPLGPFLSKNFASSLSPWVVTMEALAPFRAPFQRPDGDPLPLPYLDSADNRDSGLLDIWVEAYIESSDMRAAGKPPMRLSRSNFRDAAYWTPAQLVAHHTIGGCNLNPGDLFGSGTLSGPAITEAGSLLEATFDGKQPIVLPTSEQRTYLLDGDKLILRGRCERENCRSIGFGECSGTITAAPQISPS